MFCFTIIYESNPTVCGPNLSFKLKLHTPKTSTTVKNINLIYYDIIYSVYIYMLVCLYLTRLAIITIEKGKKEEKRKKKKS